MTAITAALVKELREMTGAGMMECKRALETSQGSLDGAVEELRKLGGAKAGKKAGRVAAEGAIAILENAAHQQAVMIELNCETDFVARDTNFVNFLQALAKTALQHQVTDIDVLNSLPLVDHEGTAETIRQGLVAKLGENIQIRRAVLSAANRFIGSYLHGNHRIGVVVELDIENPVLARDIAMHIAASKPLVISQNDVPQDLIEKEKEIYAAQAANSGKPKDIVEKMVLGRLKKYLDEISLLGQPFVKDPDITVGNLLNKQRANVLAFYRYEVGEGIEKVVEDFKEAVMSQVQGS